MIAAADGPGNGHIVEHKVNGGNGKTSGMPELAEARPTDARGWFERGLKSAQLGFPDKASADFEEASWLDPEDYEIQFNLGTAYLSMGMFEQALRNLTRAVDLSPDMSDAIGNRAVAYTALGQDDEAAKDVRRAVDLGAPPDGLAAILEYVKTKRRPEK